MNKVPLIMIVIIVQRVQDSERFSFNRIFPFSIIVVLSWPSVSSPHEMRNGGFNFKYSTSLTIPLSSFTPYPPRLSPAAWKTESESAG